MLSNLYHSPASKPCGAATVGCTEACLLSGLAAKKLWQRRRRATGKSTDRPNLVVGAHFQVREPAQILLKENQHRQSHQLAVMIFKLLRALWICSTGVLEEVLRLL